MSISGSLSSALSGLTVAARAAEIVSSNIANATTEGYGRRVLQTTSRMVGSTGQGVTITGVLRIVNMAIVGDRRLAQAGTGDRDVRASFYKRLEDTLGTPDLPHSLNGRIAAFDTSLIEAASRPESEARLSRVVETARVLVSQIDTASQSIQASRASADDKIASDVARVNTTLARIAEINTQIRADTGTSRDPSALLDQRQQLIDSIARIIPVREVARADGVVALFTTGGGVLLDGRPAELGFTSAGYISAEMSLASGALSGLTLNGRPITTSGDQSLISGGSLAAHFAVRDELAPAAQEKLDAVARDLVDRFSDPGLDATRAPGDPGLFTDAGGAFNAANEVGLSQRLRLNAAVDPTQGGALWRIRDGLGAASPQAAGDASLLNDLQMALSTPRNPVSGGFMLGERSLATLSADMLSVVAAARLTAQGEASYAQARTDALKTMELADGVDTDQEMLSLLLIEQAYAANVKVVTTIDEMIQLLLGM